MIIVDDGSSDEGPALVVKYVDQHIKLVRQSNSGPSAARNKGVEHAKIPWVDFIDADDIWHPDHLLIHSDAICQHPPGSLPLPPRCNHVPSRKAGDRGRSRRNLLHNKYTALAHLPRASRTVCGHHSIHIRP